MLKKDILNNSLQFYFCKLDIKEKNLTENEVKNVFLNIVSDFKNEKISLDDLSKLANELFFKLTAIKGNDQKLLNTIIAAQELSYYVRNERLIPQFNMFILEVLNYK